ncbi:pyridoxal phosphate-dependent transferase [Podospora conica]|nr:pyridoxal phosphate-dependent transferase [Schizothecium conicum]
MADPPQKKQINLLRGWPAPSLLPAPLLAAAAATVLSDPSLYVPALQYGPDPGYQPLREALATWLGTAYGSTPDDTADNICITGGASQSVACILQSFTDVGATRGVWVVEPGYFLVGGMVRDAGLGGVMRGVRESPDGEGIDVRALEEGMRAVDAAWEAREAVHGPTPTYKSPAPHRKLYRHIIYLVPTFNNPSATTLSLPRRTALVHLARKHDALLLCDDVYDFLQWPTSPPSSTGPIPLGPLLPRLSTLDMALGPSAFETTPGKVFGHALSNGTFSKLLGPGVRTGWVHAASDFVHGLAQTGSSRSGGAPSQVAAAVVCRVVEDGGLGRWLEEVVRPGLRRRVAGVMVSTE